MSAKMQFDQFAGDYERILNQSVAASGEDSAYFSEYKALYLRRLLPSVFSGKVLDFGCGIGLLSSFLKKHLPTSRVDGFDVSRESIQTVDSALVQQGVFTSDSAQLSRDYQLIFVANVFHHIARAARQKVFDDLADRLGPGGNLVIFEHNPANPVTRWVVERCPFDKDAVLLRPAETIGYAKAAGLAVLRRDYIVFMPRFLAWLRRLEPGLAWLPAGAQYAVVARKNP
jgi:2-polyprenyl-3-methyl-5-hydroxy-6-metoxy-1,4-benzoquinol methylase